MACCRIQCPKIQRHRPASVTVPRRSADTGIIACHSVVFRDFGPITGYQRMTHLPASPAEILLVEDDENYAYLAQRAFGKAKLPANLHHVNNGKKCLQFLRQQFPYRSAPVPDIILLDLDMPVMDGR